MDLKNAIAGRKSIRDFKPDAVPKELLDKIMAAATKAPSNSNRQPWEFLVVTGKKLKELVAGIDASLEAGGAGRASRDLKTSDDKWPAPEDGQRRASELMRGLIEAARNAGVAPADFIRSNFHFFGAPCVIVALMEKGYGYGSLVSLGAAIENLLLAAFDLGLGSCWMMIPLDHGEVFQRLFGIPEGKILVSTIALGYAKDSKINDFKSSRDPQEKVIKFFD